MNIRFLFLVCTPLLCCLPLFGNPQDAREGDIHAIWNDPIFQKQFIRSVVGAGIKG